jgi:hypothetical protein
MIRHEKSRRAPRGRARRTIAAGVGRAGHGRSAAAAGSGNGGAPQWSARGQNSDKVVGFGFREFVKFQINAAYPARRPPMKPPALHYDVDYPDDLNVFAHFPIFGLEDLGFVPRGKAGAFIVERNTAPRQQVATQYQPPSPRSPAPRSRSAEASAACPPPPTRSSYRTRWLRGL